MSEKEKGMAQLLARTDREEIFSAVIAYVNPDVSTILDLGCGIGALTTRLATGFPLALVVGFDKSKYLLNKVRKERNIMTACGDIPYLPFRKNSFDLVVAVQVLHEILCFIGNHALARTFQNIFNLLKENGKLIIFNHVNPGGTQVSLKLSEVLLKKLQEFQLKFKPRKITYDDLGKGRICTSLRNFYDFVTKIWSLDSELEEEEMSETHTPFTGEELANLVQEAGFKVAHTTSLTSINGYLEYYGITLESEIKLPNNHIVVQAIKS